MLPADPIILFSVVNTLLRDKYTGLDALCDGEDADKTSLCVKLAEAGYEYRADLNQFV